MTKKGRAGSEPSVSNQARRCERKTARGPIRRSQPRAELYTEKSAEAMVEQVRAALARDNSPETLAALNTELAREIESFWGYWFQRIEFPAQHISSTSNHKWACLDEGGLNTLGGRLTSDEASIMRPFPKWLYIEPVLPDLRGKSVLELGTCNGFFSFRFAEAGAASVTGVEVVERTYASAVWACRRARSQERRVPEH